MVAVTKVGSVKLSAKVKHGTLTAYKHYGCRCEPCNRANLESAKKHRGIARKKFASKNSAEIARDFKHGTIYVYDMGCRCIECKAIGADTRLRFKKAAREHFQLTGEFRSAKSKHGTYSAYSSYGCRCELCKSAYNLYQQNKSN